MNKYIFEEKIGITYNASSKAREDVNLFAKNYRDKNGNAYIVIGGNDKSNVKTTFGKILCGIKAILSLLKLKRNDILFVQSSFKILRKIDMIKKFIGFRTIYLVHDLDALRDSYTSDSKVSAMIQELEKQDIVILHNDKMIEELHSRGCKTQMINLGIFDYYLESVPPITYPKKSRMDLCFAGNLSPKKTGFLYALDQQTNSFNVNVYGKKEEEFQKISYKGCYKPEELPEKLEGDFGLIWEGNQFTYNEDEHPYIMFNNPHKASLYIVAGLPIIVWEKAAIADLVIERGIGITISDVVDIEEKLSQISSDDYLNMKRNLEIFRKTLIAGEHVHKAIRSAEEILNV